MTLLKIEELPASEALDGAMLRAVRGGLAAMPVCEGNGAPAQPAMPSLPSLPWGMGWPGLQAQPGWCGTPVPHDERVTTPVPPQDRAHIM